MRVLVTGATGFLGGLLARHLARENHQVHTLCRRTADVTSLQQDNIRILWGDILDPASVGAAMDGCRRVFHLAAYARSWARDKSLFYDVNIGGLKNVLDAAVKASVERVVFTSTSLTSGPSHGSETRETDGPPGEFFTDYERSKFLAEREVQSTYAESLDVVTVNPTRVFGPGVFTEGNSVTRLIHRYVQGRWRLILGNGKAVGNYAYAPDVIRGHVLAMERGRRGEKYILGGTNATLGTFFSVLGKVSGRRRRLVSVPGEVAIALARGEEIRARWLGGSPLITPSWVMHFLSDWAFSSSRAEMELGYHVTPLEEGIRKTIRWLQSHER